MIMRLHVMIPNKPNIHSTQRERVMDAMRVQHLECGEYKSDEVLASKILDFWKMLKGLQMQFKEVLISTSL